MSRDDYAFPCAGCLCDHCANNLYSSDQMAGEAKIFCYVCEECRYYDGDLKNKYERKKRGSFDRTCNADSLPGNGSERRM